MQTQSKQVIDIAKVVGGGYGTFWRFKGRYCVVKGSRASKKSKTTALWHIYNIMKYPGANALVVRKTERTLKDSVFSDLRWAIDRLGVTEFWKATTNPLELTYVPTGQKILFRGFDDSLKITSISVPKGILCFVWCEECYEISKEEDFDMLDESIRGSLDGYPGLFKRLTLTMNPWSDKHWVRRRFFDPPNTENKLAMTTTWRCNEWLDDNDKRLFEEMKIRNPRRWRVASEGEWGVIDGLIYDNWVEKEFDHKEVSKRSGVHAVFGLDFGFSNDPSALFCGLIDPNQKEIYVFDEMYEKNMTNPKIAEEVIRMGFAKEKITADSAEPKSIEELYGLGMRRIRKARKGRDSIRAGINYIQNFKIIIHPRCVNFLTEISNYIWEEDKLGNKTNKPIDDFNHLMDAMRYALEDFSRGSLVGFD